MAGVVRKDTDSAGGILIGGSSNVFCENHPVVRIGDAVQGHGSGPHSSPKMNQGSPNVFVNGIPLCRAGDTASCGHTASGSSTVFAN